MKSIVHVLSLRIIPRKPEINIRETRFIDELKIGSWLRQEVAKQRVLQRDLRSKYAVHVVVRMVAWFRRYLSRHTCCRAERCHSRLVIVRLGLCGAQERRDGGDMLMKLRSSKIPAALEL